MNHKNVKGIFSEFDAYCQTLNRNGCITYPVTITWTEEGRHYGKAMVIIFGEPHAADDLPPGELQVPFEILDEVRQAGYNAQSVTTTEIKHYWLRARRLSIKNHWHPEARLIQY